MGRNFALRSPRSCCVGCFLGAYFNIIVILHTIVGSSTKDLITRGYDAPQSPQTQPKSDAYSKRGGFVRSSGNESIPSNPVPRESGLEAWLSWFSSTEKADKNPILRENEQAGTSDWVLSKPAMNREIEGYMSRTSVQKGNTILLFFNTASEYVVIDIFRTGWYGGIGARRYAGPVTISGVKQFVPRPDEQNENVVSCNWTDPYMVKTDDDWTTGVYLARMTESGNRTQSYAIFVVRDDNRAIGPDVMFQLPVNTYQAYNYWGGKSLDGWGSGGPNSLPWGYNSKSRQAGAKKVSFDRPYARSNNPDAAFGNGAGEYLSNVQPIHKYPLSSASWNYNMVRWLERNGIDTSYITNVDVHGGLDRLVKPKLFLTQGHDEYWSWEMRDHVEGLRDQGVSLAFLGSNTAFMQVRFENASGTVNTNDEPRIMVCYRFMRKEPITNHLRTLKWREVGRPESNMIGVAYIGDPFDADLVIANASHWVFNGTGLSNGDVLPGLLGYEVDGRDPKSKINIDLLFETKLVRINETFMCHGTFYTASSRAHVFSPGTMQWSWGLDDYGVMQNLRSSRLNHVVEVITWNVFVAAGVRPNGLLQF